MELWLFKGEPLAWSYEKVAGLGAAGPTGSGVRNHTAKLDTQVMKVGEQAFFYHSNEGKEIVGIVEDCKAYRPDPTDATGKFGTAINSRGWGHAGSGEGGQASGQHGACHPVSALRSARDRYGCSIESSRVPLAQQSKGATILLDFAGAGQGRLRPAAS